MQSSHDPSPISVYSDGVDVSRTLVSGLLKLGACDVQIKRRGEYQHFLPTDPPRIHLLDVVGDPHQTATQIVDSYLECGLLGPLYVLGDCQSGHAIARWSRLGITDYLDWPMSDSELRDMYTYAQTLCQRAMQMQREFRSLKDRIESITSREHEVMDLVIQGTPNKSIAMRLAISERTVEARRQKVYQKMHAFRLPDLIRMLDRFHQLEFELRRPTLNSNLTYLPPNESNDQGGCSDGAA